MASKKELPRAGRGAGNLEPGDWMGGDKKLPGAARGAGSDKTLQSTSNDEEQQHGVPERYFQTVNSEEWYQNALEQQISKYSPDNQRGSWLQSACQNTRGSWRESTLSR